MRAADQFKTAFQTHHGHFEYKVMPMGSLEEDLLLLKE
jgi:hypothetical protein